MDSRIKISIRQQYKKVLQFKFTGKKIGSTQEAHDIFDSFEVTCMLGLPSVDVEATY